MHSFDLLTRRIDQLPIAGGVTTFTISLNEQICYFVKDQSVVGVTFDGEVIGEMEFDFCPSALLLVDESTLWISGRRTYILNLESSTSSLIDEIRSQMCFQILKCPSTPRVFCVGDHVDIYDLKGNIIDRIGRSTIKAATGPYSSLWLSRTHGVHPDDNGDAILLDDRVFYAPGSAATSLTLDGLNCLAIAESDGHIAVYEIL